MKIGAVYPQTELKGDPRGLDRIGRSVEELGYDHFLMYDHVVGAVHENRNPPIYKYGPYTDQHSFHDPLVSLSYLAGITKKIELVTGILILPQRPTALVARQAADLDLLSNQRLRLGVSVGWNYVEYDVLGQNFKMRGRRLNEQIEVLRHFWSDPLVSYEGAFHKIDRVNINPRPNRQIPIYCGGYTEPAFRRAAKLGDGFLFATGIDTALASWQKVGSYLNEEGRSREEFGAELILKSSSLSEEKLQSLIDAARRWQDAGGSHISIVSMGLGFGSIPEHIDYFAKMRHRLDTL